MVGLTASLADRSVPQPSKASATMVVEMSRAVRQEGQLCACSARLSVRAPPRSPATSSTAAPRWATPRSALRYSCCPVGGYFMTSDREAEPVAVAYLAEGFNAFVLRYRAGAEAP